MSRTVQTGLTDLTRYLRNAGIDSAGRDARLLLAHVMGVTPDRMTLIAPDPLHDDQIEEAFVLAARRGGGAPVSHILGYRDFYGRRFSVNEHVLDPRPETELLVELALAQPFAEVLDLGTGSGAILLTLLAERPEATGIGTDLSGAALEVAARNAGKLGVEDRLALVRSNWFTAVAGAFDLIVSNPPYIALDEMADLGPELAHEPRMALTDDADGLSAYRMIVPNAPSHLRPGGRLLVEIGAAQGQDVAGIFHASGLEDVAIHHDLDGRDRVISGCKP